MNKIFIFLILFISLITCNSYSQKIEESNKIAFKEAVVFIQGGSLDDYVLEAFKKPSK